MKELAATHPKFGSPWKLRNRRVFPEGFKFSGVYRIEPEELVVFAVTHFRRRPTYGAVAGDQHRRCACHRRSVRQCRVRPHAILGDILQRWTR